MGKDVGAIGPEIGVAAAAAAAAVGVVVAEIA